LTDLFLGPDEGLSFVVICFDIGIDVLLELFEACEGGAAERLPLQDREPYLDLIEPGPACRSEMKLHIGMGLEPVLVLFVGVEVVEDDVKFAFGKAVVTLLIFPVATSSAANSVVVPCRL